MINTTYNGAFQVLRKILCSNNDRKGKKNAGKLSVDITHQLYFPETFAIRMSIEW